jgi:hypothetical protein
MFMNDWAVVAISKTGAAPMFYTAVVILNVAFLATMAVLFVGTQ